MKRFKGKAIYQPSGKAAEYSPWACNFYTGCSNDCEYCYCKRGVMAHVWSNKPKLKKCFKNDEKYAFEVFEKEMMQNIEQLREKGLFFSFTTDPMLPETSPLTLVSAIRATDESVPVKILTKRADFCKTFQLSHQLINTHLLAIGFTLTGFDEKEPGASSNLDRINCMKELHDMGFKTFASIEPVITPAMSLEMIRATKGFCDLYLVGLMSGKKIDYESLYIRGFLDSLIKLSYDNKIYLKESFLNWFGIDKCVGEFVDADYNIFKL